VQRDLPVGDQAGHHSSAADPVPTLVDGAKDWLTVAATTQVHPQLKESTTGLDTGVGDETQCLDRHQALATLAYRAKS